VTTNGKTLSGLDEYPETNVGIVTMKGAKLRHLSMDLKP